MSDEWLSVRQAAARLGRSEFVVRRAISQGDLEAYAFGERALSIAPGDLEAFIQKCRKGGDAAGDVAGGNQDLKKTA